MLFKKIWVGTFHDSGILNTKVLRAVIFSSFENFSFRISLASDGILKKIKQKNQIDFMTGTETSVKKLTELSCNVFA
jgi:cobalamin biosynthesis Co2+ chelatase CbiK